MFTEKKYVQGEGEHEIKGGGREARQGGSERTGDQQGLGSEHNARSPGMGLKRMRTQIRHGMAKFTPFQCVKAFRQDAGEQGKGYFHRGLRI
jgi:hypothetical protein